MQMGGSKSVFLTIKKAPAVCRSLENSMDEPEFYALKELPQPQVLLTLGLLNLKPAPSTLSM
jgi:hypothetical protein